MEFRLIYKGSLPAQGAKAGSRVKEKHVIRRQLHPQLRELWHGDQLLSRYAQEADLSKKHIKPEWSESERATGLDLFAEPYTKFGYRFIPLVGTEFGIACALDILFLRRDNPGNLIRSGGDIDNRMKVLFDALTVPKDASHVKDMPAQVGEDPFFCLLEDDTRVTDVKITTDLLLVPMEKCEDINDVQLVLYVKTKIVDITRGFHYFA